MKAYLWKVCGDYSVFFLPDWCVGRKTHKIGQKCISPCQKKAVILPSILDRRPKRPKTIPKINYKLYFF